MVRIEKIKNDILKNSKITKVTPNNTQKQKIKQFKKAYKGASNEKSLENKPLLELKNIKNDIFKNFYNLIITPKTQKPKIQENQKAMK